MMSKEEQQPMIAQRTDSGSEASGIITYPPEYSTGITNIGLWPSSREHFINSTCALVNIFGFESHARSDLALLASVTALYILLGKGLLYFVKWYFTKRNEICTLRNGNLNFAKWKSVLCEMEICTLRNENLYFAKLLRNGNLQYFAK